jgi:16S rRNA (adenine1518-N6/adenine1519-N6)-dimethyltransferase
MELRNIIGKNIMNLTSPTQVKSWCISNGFHPNKTLGQNFLVDKNVLLGIVDAGLQGTNKGEVVLEIGPGLGVMTEEMLSRGMKVTAIEKDPVLADRLREYFSSNENFSIVTGDALDEKCVAAAQEVFGAPKTLVSNLPYQAGTRILLEFVQKRNLDRMTVLLQTEVARRLAALEGSKERSLAGVWAQLDYDVSVIKQVSASCFWPRPEVGSSVARLEKHEKNASIGESVRKTFHFLTKKAFEHRRKQLGSIFKDMIQSTARAEELSNEQWIILSKGLTDENT